MEKPFFHQPGFHYVKSISYHDLKKKGFAIMRFIPNITLDLIRYALKVIDNY